MRENCIYRRLARIMAMLPSTSEQMAKAVGIRQDTVRDWLRWMRAEGLVKSGSRTKAAGLLWDHGNGVGFVMSGAQPPETIKRFAALWKLLSKRQTAKNLQTTMKVSRRASEHMMQCLRVEGAVRIAGWQMSGQSLVPIYDRLPGKDAPKPARLPRGETNAKYWARRRDALRERGLSLRDRLPSDLRTRPAANGALQEQA